LEESLQAQVRDPLWMLARQWQFGEFQGEDAGSLVQAELVVEAGQVDSYYPGPQQRRGAHVKYDPASTPLETLVEAEPPQHRTPVDYRHAARAGQMFLRLLRQRLGRPRERTLVELLVSDFIALFPLDTQPDMDDETRSFLQVMARGTPDGVALWEQLSRGPDWQRSDRFHAPLNRIATVDGTVQDSFFRAVKDWINWYDGLITPPPANPAWDNERMEYAFALSAPYERSRDGQLELSAAEYPGGRLDWYAFDVHANRDSTGRFRRLPTIRVAPTQVEFRGMPAKRFWQFEEGQVDFGLLDTAPEDLSKMLFAEFALAFGNDFFYVPVTLPVGSISRVRSLKVRNTFGEEFTIKSASQVDAPTNIRPPWRMFCLSPAKESDGAAPEYMFLPPTLIQDIASPPIEEVLLLRDEMANMAWAVERLVLNPVGKTINRHEQYQLALQRERDRREQQAAGSTAPASGPLTYRLFSPVPDYWNPMLLERSSGEVRFQIKGLEDVQGALLAPYREHPDLRLHEEEVPRSGVRITRSYQYARWSDGSGHLWIGRTKQPGRGEGYSGLKYDFLELASPTPTTVVP
jgi:hypothetical protein